jgi:hypothetical protein
MSSHDARQDSSQGYDEPGSTTTRTDPQSSDRDAPITDDGPVLLPVDSAPEPTVDDRVTAPDSAPVTMVDADEPAEVGPGGREVITDREETGDRVTGERDASADADRVDGRQASVGPDTETGALKDPVPEGSFDTGAASGTSGTVDSAGAAESVEPAGTAGSVGSAGSAGSAESSADWHELQGRFVDDPQAAVREAGALVEKAFNDLRTRSETGSTEDLRTAFRRYRELYAQLS